MSRLAIIFIFTSSRASRSCRAPREISRSPRLAHKAPVMQAMSRSEPKRLGEEKFSRLPGLPEMFRPPRRVRDLNVNSWLQRMS